MSKLDGGIFSNPRGKTAGIVFGAARTRQGKKVTARQLVPPSNPNTASQQTQRSKFSDSLDIVRFLGADIYQDDFNRSVSQLPGFQSMMSLFMNAMDASRELSEPAPVNLGNLHYPATVQFLSTVADRINVDFSQEVGDNGTVDDRAVAFAVDTTALGRGTLIGGYVIADAVRDDGSTTILNLTTGQDYLTGFYFRGQGDAEGLLSQCKWGIVTVT